MSCLPRSRSWMFLEEEAKLASLRKIFWTFGLEPFSRFEKGYSFIISARAELASQRTSNSYAKNRKLASFPRLIDRVRLMLRTYSKHNAS